jgi:hypothetical protein
MSRRVKNRLRCGVGEPKLGEHHFALVDRAAGASVSIETRGEL